MKILNLVYHEKSDIKYKIQKFPDGQQNVYVDPDLKGTTVEEFWAIPGNSSAFKSNIRQKYIINQPNNIIQIKSRLNNWLDLELITCAIASLRELGIEDFHLYVPYILGARSDRKFQGGGNNYLRDVICPAINALGCRTVTCIDPHSDCLEMGIKGFRKKSNINLVNFAHKDIIKNNSSLNPFILVSPDAGASKKIYKLAEQIGYHGGIITCSKDRDKEGKLTRFKIDLSSVQDDNKDYIIIDDICDGGATFINIASMLKGATTGKIYLIVTHGIFSKGFDELSKYFDGIYCTNSYSDLSIRLAVNSAINTKFHNNLVKQLNVF